MMKGFQTVFPRGRKRLKENITYSQLIPRVLERHDVMGIAENASVLAQVGDRDVLMGTFAK